MLSQNLSHYNKKSNNQQHESSEKKRSLGSLLPSPFTVIG
jgi:hypothetical protein